MHETESAKDVFEKEKDRQKSFDVGQKSSGIEWISVISIAWGFTFTNKFIIWQACSLFIINSWMFHVNIHLLNFMKKWKMIIHLIVYLFYIFVFNMSIGCCATQTKTIHKSTAIFTQFITQKQHDFWVETTHGNETHTKTHTLTVRTFNWK